jgi:arylsulfatase A-like enzyme
LTTDAYARQSCTAGRSTVIPGEHPFRTGLLTISMPGLPQLASWNCEPGALQIERDGRLTFLTFE